MIRILPLAFFVLITQTLYSQSKAGEYLDQIGQQIQMITNESMAYTSAANHGKSARKVEKRRNDLIQQVKDSETTVRKMKPFDGSTAFRDSIVTYFKITGIVLNRDYGKIVDLEDVAEQSYDKMEAYMMAKERASDKLDQAGTAAMLQYRSFAASNNITLSENNSDLSKKIEKSNQVTHYANRAYLLFFKSYKNEAYLMEAMSKNDLTSLEQSRNALATSSADDLTKSKELPAFEDDMSLKAALQNALQFFKLEAGQKMEAYVQFLVAKDNFDKVKKAFEATPSNKRTKEAVDTYNAAIKDVNKKIEAFNKSNGELNKMRSAMYKQWNEAYENFLDKHTPKHRG